jgi:hypothetical protein
MAFPLTVPQTARSGAVRRYVVPVQPIKVITATRAKAPFPLQYHNRTGTVRKYVAPQQIQKLVSNGVRTWAPIAIFGHLTPRPTYGQIWPRGTMAGPPH